MLTPDDDGALPTEALTAQRVSFSLRRRSKEGWHDEVDGVTTPVVTPRALLRARRTARFISRLRRSEEAEDEDDEDDEDAHTHGDVGVGTHAEAQTYDHAAATALPVAAPTTARARARSPVSRAPRSRSLALPMSATSKAFGAADRLNRAQLALGIAGVGIAAKSPARPEGAAHSDGEEEDGIGHAPPTRRLTTEEHAREHADITSDLKARRHSRWQNATRTRGLHEVVVQLEAALHTICDAATADGLPLPVGTGEVAGEVGPVVEAMVAKEMAKQMTTREGRARLVRRRVLDEARSMGTPPAVLVAWKRLSDGGSERALPNGVHCVVLEQILIRLISSFPALRIIKGGVSCTAESAQDSVGASDGQVGVLEPGGVVGQGAALRFHVRLVGSESVLEVMPANLRGCRLPDAGKAGDAACAGVGEATGELHVPTRVPLPTTSQSYSLYYRHTPSHDAMDP